MLISQTSTPLIIVGVNYGLVALTSLWLIAKGTQKWLQVLAVGMGVIFVACGLHYFSLLKNPDALSHFQDNVLWATAVASFVAIACYNPYTLGNLNVHIEKLALSDRIRTLKNNYSLQPEVVLDYVDFNTLKIVEINQAMLDFLNVHGLLNDNAKVGGNFYEVFPHPQEWKLNNHKCAVNKVIFAKELFYWKDKDIWLWWSITPLNHSYIVIQWIDTTDTQKERDHLREELDKLKKNLDSCVDERLKLIEEKANGR